MSTDQKKIRNFAIIAHIDHGKSTLADRIIELCGGLTAREMHAQVLDSMAIEQERNITIKTQTVRLFYKGYQINLLDTPGHVDFGYEVNRALGACEGSILVVDATQGVEAQTLANAYKAIEANHAIVVALNKIDIPSADIDGTKKQIEDVIGIDASDAVLISAKTGAGVPDLLDKVIELLPAPQGSYEAPLKAMLVDSWYDTYLGVVILVRIFDGALRKGMRVKMLSTNSSYNIENVGIFTPKKQIADQLSVGEVGFITAGIKQLTHCKIGDTITEESNPCAEALPGFKYSQPVVFCSLYPIDASEFTYLQESLTKYQLNDASFVFEVETSNALGFGFRCGFLGLLHLEIVQERLEREFNVNLITTAPSVVYKIHLRSGDVIDIHNPADFPDPTLIDFAEEPWIRATIMCPEQFLGDMFSLCIERRGVQISMNYVGNRVMLVYKLPLNEIVYDFYDQMKSLSKGYASFDWEFDSYQLSDLVKISILVNHEPVDALSMLLYRSRAESRGRALCLGLKDLISRHLFPIAIQAAIGGKIIARETISAMRKDVTAKCYGGDISRKRKLLDKQKAGKKRMRSFGKVSIPQSAFISVLKTKT